MSALIQLLVNAAIPAVFFGLVAASFSLIYRVTGVLHLAHGGVVILAAYVFSRMLKSGLGSEVSILAAILIAALAGLGMSLLVYEPLRRGRKVALMGSLIAAIALLLFLNSLILLLFGSRPEVVNIWRSEPWLWGSIAITPYQVILILIGLAAIAALGFIVSKTKLGKAMRAVADNAEVAAVVGIPPARVRHWAFLIGSICAGLAGVLFAAEYGFDTQTGISTAIKSFSRAVIGGIGSIPGALLGSFIVELGENTWATFLPFAFREVVTFVLVIAVLLWRPRGLLGRKSI